MLRRPAKSSRHATKCGSSRIGGAEGDRRGGLNAVVEAIAAASVVLQAIGARGVHSETLLRLSILYLGLYLGILFGEENTPYFINR